MCLDLHIGLPENVYGGEVILSSVMVCVGAFPLCRVWTSSSMPTWSTNLLLPKPPRRLSCDWRTLLPVYPAKQKPLPQRHHLLRQLTLVSGTNRPMVSYRQRRRARMVALKLLARQRRRSKMKLRDLRHPDLQVQSQLTAVSTWMFLFSRINNCVMSAVTFQFFWR